MLQVWFLFAAWWFRVNWLIAYSWDIFGGALPEHFRNTVAAPPLALPVNEPMEFEPFADRVIKTVGWTWPEKEHDNTRMIIRAAIEHMVIRPLENFGVLTTQREKEPVRLFDIQVLKSFTKTRFGHLLLETVQNVG